MYTTFYQLSERPFSTAPDPSCIYLTPQHREAISGLVYAILDRKGYMALSGEVGTGKTSVLAAALKHIATKRVHTSVILNPTLTPAEFLELALLDFGFTDIPASKAQRLSLFQNFLITNYQEGRISALIIDEAHKLSLEVLEEIRLLGNFDFAGQNLLQIVLIGQTELDKILDRQDMRQFKHRIAVRVAIRPLSEADTRNYMQFRWRKAGGQASIPFLPEAVTLIGRYCQGIPRLINVTCDNALLLGYAEESSDVTAKHVLEALTDLHLISSTDLSREMARLSLAAVPVAVETAGNQELQQQVQMATNGDLGNGKRGPANFAVRNVPFETLNQYSRPSFLTRWFRKRADERTRRTEQPA